MGEKDTYYFTMMLYDLALHPEIKGMVMVVKYIDESIEEALSDMLNIGNNINIVEPLRDFNGFSWNIITKDIEDLNYNLLYQHHFQKENLQALLALN